MTKPQAVGLDDDTEDAYHEEARKKPAARKPKSSRVWGHYFTKQAGYQDVLKLLQKRDVMLDRSFPFSHGGLGKIGHTACVAGYLKKLIADNT